jgi:hypothetical protein
MCRAVSAVAIGLVTTSFWTAARAQGDAPSPPLVPGQPIQWALICVSILIGLLLFYVWGLRQQLTEMVRNSPPETSASNLAAFNQLPMGLPSGTVRAVLALIVVFGSIIFLAMSLLDSQKVQFPQTLSGILGAVLGFYFGKTGMVDGAAAVSAVNAANTDTRNAIATAADATKTAQDAKDSATALQGQLDTATAQADQAQQDKAAALDKVDTLSQGHLDNIQSGLSQAAKLGSTLAGLLPGAAGRDIGTAASALTTTLNTVSELRQGDMTDAVAQAGNLVSTALPNQPVVQVLAKAASAFAPVIGTLFPPAALVTTIIGIGSQLSAAAYARWVARIMDAPYTPEQFSPTVLNSTGAQAALQQVPVLATAFAAMLRGGDNAGVLQVVKTALSDDPASALAQAFPTELGSMDPLSLTQAAHDLQKAVLDVVVQAEMPASVAADVPKVLHAVDLIRADSGASAALDVVMTTVGALKQSGQHPDTAFKEALQALDAQAKKAA